MKSNYEEIRRVRKEMSAKAGHDVRRLVAAINEKRSEKADLIINPGGDAEQSATPRADSAKAVSVVPKTRKEH